MTRVMEETAMGLDSVKRVQQVSDPKVASFNASLAFWYYAGTSYSAHGIYHDHPC